jgi:hypothetical protein
MQTTLTMRELATVLAALNAWRDGLPELDSDSQYAPHFADVASRAADRAATALITAEAIDTLCKRLNDEANEQDK